MDSIVQKATELGVQRIVPLSCEFSVVRLDAASRAAARASIGAPWRSPPASSAAAIASRRSSPSAISPRPAPPAAPDLRLMLLPQAPESLAALAAGLRSAVLLVGPEGGLSGREQLQAQRSGFRPCRLGPRILRTETAPLAALAALQALAGDLR